MSLSNLSFARRHVLGDLYDRCDAVVGDIPLYLKEEEAQVLLGYVNESLGKYADAFTFHLDDVNSKKLSAGHFGYAIDCEQATSKTSKRAVRVVAITLIARKPYPKPEPKSRAAKVEEAPGLIPETE